MHVVEVGPDLRRCIAVGRKAEGDTDRHGDQAEAEDRVDLADDLVDGDKSGDAVISQNDRKPGRRCGKEPAVSGLIGIDELHNQACRADSEHGADHDQEDHGEDTHDGLHRVAEVHTGYLGDGNTIVSLREHSGHVVMDTACKDGTEGDPEEHDGSPQSTLHGTEDRSEACDVQKLHQEQFPLRHNHVVDAIIDGDSRRIAVVRCEDVVHKSAVGKIPADQQSETQKKANHLYTPLSA